MKWRDFLCLLAVALLPLLSYPLSWLPSAWVQFRYTVVLPWAAVLFVILLLAAAKGALAGQWTLVPRRFLWPCGFLTVSWVVSVTASQHRDFSILALPPILGNLALFWVATSFSKDRLRTLGWIWLSVASVVAVNGLARLGVEEQFVSTIGNRNFLGAYLAAAIPLAIVLGSRWAAVPGALLLGALCFTKSRGAWLALGIVVILWIAVVWLRVGSVRKRMTAMAVGIGLVVLLVFPAHGYVRNQWRTDVRPVIWRGTVQMIAAHPILGHGLGTYWLQYTSFRLPEYFARPKAGNFTNHAHNELLETAAEQGVVGLGALLWLWTIALTTGVRAANTTETRCSLRYGIVGATLVFMLHGMVDVDLRSPPNQSLLWLLLGLLASGSGEEAGRISFRTRPARSVVAGVCTLLAVWILYVAVIQPVRADCWERQARLAEVRGDLNAAVRAARRSLEIQPLRVETRYFLAGVLAENPATYKDAIGEGLVIEGLAPDYSDLTYNIGELYIKLNQPHEALPFLQRAVSMNPYSAEKRFALALAFAESSEPAAAEEQLEAALRLKPDFAEAADLLQRLRHQPKPGHD